MVSNRQARPQVRTDLGSERLSQWFCGEKQNGARLGAVLFQGSGGAGIRTPVRDKIDHSVYVRIPPIEVSSRWPVDSPRLNKSPKLSPVAGRRDDGLSRFCDTRQAASGGLPNGQVL